MQNEFNDFYNSGGDASLNDIDNSGTFDLAASYGRPKVQHVQQTFGGDSRFQGINEVAQALDILGIGPEDSSGRYNLAKSGAHTGISKFNDSELYYGLNLGNSLEKSKDIDHFQLASSSVRGGKKYAAIDHFKEEDPFEERPQVVEEQKSPSPVKSEAKRPQTPEEKQDAPAAPLPPPPINREAQTSPLKQLDAPQYPTFES